MSDKPIWKQVAEIGRSVPVEALPDPNDIVERLRENIIADAFARMEITSGTMAQRLILERHEAANEIERLRAEVAALREDEERMTFLHDRCSLNFLWKRDDGTAVHIAGPTNLRAAIDAARRK